MIQLTGRRTAQQTKQQEWMNAHKTLHITNNAYSSVLKHAGMLQSKRGKHVSVSEAIEDLARIAEEQAGGDMQ
jgi:DNA-binding transcriptional regulator YhcF (GntR family)